MNKSKILLFATVLFVLATGFTKTFGQQNQNRIADPNYEIVLQTLISSDQAKPGKRIPTNLSETVAKLKSNYNFADYQLISTHLQRVGNKGNVSHKSLFDELNMETEDRVFSNWSLRNLMVLNDSKQQKQINFRFFNFEAKIPLKTGLTERQGKMESIINYEPIGLMIEGFSVPENKPTLIGTLGMPKSDHLIFFVLTVKPVD